MKLSLMLLVLMCAAVFVHAEGDKAEQITTAEIQELIADYKELNSDTSPNAPIREMAQKTKDLTMKYFKTVGVEIAKHMCNQLDNILRAFNENTDNKIET